MQYRWCKHAMHTRLADKHDNMTVLHDNMTVHCDVYAIYIQ